MFVAVTVVPIAIDAASRPRGATQRVPVWDGGLMSYRARMQYTATTFSNPVRVTFQRLYRPDVHIYRASDDPAGSSGPVHYRTKVQPIFEQYLYRPIARFVKALAVFRNRSSRATSTSTSFTSSVVLAVAYLVYAW